MEWVKTETGSVAFNLANSGVKAYSLADLQVNFSSLVLCGPGAYGYAPLVEAIAAKCKVDTDCIATAQGTSMANHLAMAAIVEPGDEVLIEHPGYPLLWETAEYLGARLRFFARRASNAFALDLDELQRVITPATRLIVLSNLHNPSCALLTQAELIAVRDMAREAGARVLVDEVYLDALFEQTPDTCFKLGSEFVATNSLTKVYGLSGLRCGWIIAEPELIRKIYRLNDLFGVNNPYITDQMSCVALDELDRIREWSRELLARNREIAADFLVAVPELEAQVPAAGTVLFLRINEDVAGFCQRLRERYDTIVTPGDFFGAPDRIRIGIGGDTGVLREGLARIEEAISASSATRTARCSTVQRKADPV
jgi:hypothetical protein